MSRRLSHEEKATNSARRSIKLMRSKIEAMAYEFNDSEMHYVCAAADDLRDAVDTFEEELDETFIEWKEKSR